MHEVSIAQEIIDIVRNYLPDDKDTSVKSVKVAIGEFSSIHAESLKFGYKVLTKDTNLQNSFLNIENIPLTVKCHECGAESILGEPLFFCPDCSGSKVEIISGTEMKVVEIEIYD